MSHTSVEEIPRTTTAVPASGWTGRRITALAIGSLLVLIALGLLGVGGTGLWADRTQRDGGFVTTDVHDFSTAGSALTTEPTHFGSSWTGWLYSPGLLGKIRVRATPADASSPLFVGIARSADVDRYLAGVSHQQISDFWSDKTEAFPGARAAAAPRSQHFWAVSDAGRGPRTVEWHPVGGSWTVVVMNADGRPGVGVAADLGAKLPAVVWISVGLLAAGAVFLAGGVLLITGAVRRRRADSTTT